MDEKFLLLFSKRSAGLFFGRFVHRAVATWWVAQGLTCPLRRGVTGEAAGGTKGGSFLVLFFKKERACFLL
jgi:hypothetical protein